MNFDYKNPKNINLVLDWLTERYRIHKKKDVEKLPAPWTDKPGFDARYCNVMRRHDRESKNVINLVCHNKDLTMREKMLNCIIFRYLNKGDTFRLLGFPKKGKFTETEKAEITKKFNDFISTHDYQPFTGAFMVSGLIRGILLSPVLAENCPNMPENNALKMLDIWNFYYDTLEIEKYMEYDNIEDMMKALYKDENIIGTGRFLKYQIYLDWCYCPEWPKALNEDQITISGPGCSRGIWSTITGREITQKEFEEKIKEDGQTYESILRIFRDNTERYLKNYGVDIHELLDDLPENEHFIGINDWENVMCEFSKYFTYLYTNQRGKKRMYNGTPESIHEKRYDLEVMDW